MVGVAEGDEVTVTSNRGSVQAPAVADPGVPRGSVAMVVNQPNADVLSLVDCPAVVTEVRVQPA
jgi:anaerobic selenocysteine-containing dehydrogenase